MAELTGCLTFAVVVISEFIASPTADLSLATERALCVDASLSSPTVAGSQQTLIDVCTFTNRDFLIGLVFLAIDV